MKPPRIGDAPGLTWRAYKDRFEARWQCRTDIARKGFEPKSARLWFGTKPSKDDLIFIQSESRRLQDQMHVWNAGGVPEVLPFDGTIQGLIRSYQTDADSSYRRVRHETRKFYDSLCRRLLLDFGDGQVGEIKARELLRWNAAFGEAGRVTMGHACIAMLRVLLSFGSTILEDAACRELRVTLHEMRFPMGRPRDAALTAQQVVAIRQAAHAAGFPSIALAQAFQFELMLRQKDVIGEWVPMSERGVSDVLWGKHKWLRGLRWDEIAENLILRHVTSKRQKEIVVDLKLAPMVMEELALIERGVSGPVIVREGRSVPWDARRFRSKWRQIAAQCGISSAFRNMDSRAGAITEATYAGALLEHVQQAAMHSDISMTQRYARGAEEKTAAVMRQRAAHRARRE